MVSSWVMGNTLTASLKLVKMFLWVRATALGSFSLPLVKRMTMVSSGEAAGSPAIRREALFLAFSSAPSLLKVVTVFRMSSMQIMPGTIGHFIFSSRAREVIMVVKLQAF